MAGLMVAPEVLPVYHRTKQAVGQWRQPPSPPLPPEVVVTIDSTPQGAEVVRIEDGKRIGITPTRDVQRADGRTVQYQISLDGYNDTVVPFPLQSGGERSVNALLRAVSPPRSGLRRRTAR